MKDKKNKKIEEAQELLEETYIMRRYDFIAHKVVNEIQVQNVKDEIQLKLKERVDKNQREYILREEIILIREELGDENAISDAEEFQNAVKQLKASKEVKDKIQKENLELYDDNYILGYNIMEWNRTTKLLHCEKIVSDTSDGL